MRLPLVVVILAAGCGAAERPVVRTQPAVPQAAPGAKAPAPVTIAPPPGCDVALRTLSVPGRGGIHPSVASVAGSYGVVWEETALDHRGIHFQALDGAAHPLGPQVEVADLARGGAEPRVVADGDGFAIVWTIDEPDTSVISFRRVDAHGRPRGDVVSAVTAPHARALALAKVGTGFALGWWTWSADPPTENLTWLDKDGKPRGRAVRVSTGLLVDPEMALAEEGEGVRAAWVEAVNGEDHVLVGKVEKSTVSHVVDLGPGDRPSLVSAAVIFANLTDGSVWRAPFDGKTPPVRLAGGQAPSASDHRLCLYRTQVSEESSTDELSCLSLADAGAGRSQRIAVAKGGVLTLSLAAAPAQVGDGVVFQTEAGEEMQVVFAGVDCAKER